MIESTASALIRMELRGELPGPFGTMYRRIVDVVYSTIPEAQQGYEEAGHGDGEDFDGCTCRQEAILSVAATRYSNKHDVDYREVFQENIEQLDRYLRERS